MPPKATAKRAAASVTLRVADDSKRARLSTLSPISPPSTPISGSSHSSTATESDGPLSALSEDSDDSTADSPSASSPSAALSPPALVSLLGPDKCQPSSLPIFREHNIVSREPAQAAAVAAAAPMKTASELEPLTFAQWLDYHLTHPSAASNRGYLFSDEQYWHMLAYVTNYGPRAGHSSCCTSGRTPTSQCGWTTIWP